MEAHAPQMPSDGARVILERLDAIEGKLDALQQSHDRLRRYFIIRLVVLGIVILLPILGLIITIPTFMRVFSGAFGDLDASLNALRQL